MSFLGGLLGGIGGFITAGPVGAFAGALGGFKGGTAGARQALTGPQPGPQPFAPVPFAPGSNIYTQPGGSKSPAGVSCPPGTRCSGLLSYDNLCVGNCVQITTGGGGGVAQPGTGMVACRGRGGSATMVAPAIKGYHWNHGRYYVFGDCRTGTSPGVVEACTKLVRNRRVNPLNPHAARRAIRRLHGIAGFIRSYDKALGKLARGVRSKSGGARRAKCGCGQKPCRCG